MGSGLKPSGEGVGEVSAPIPEGTNGVEFVLGAPNKVSILPFCWPGLLSHHWSCVNVLYPKPGLASPLDLSHFNGLQFLSLSPHLG